MPEQFFDNPAGRLAPILRALIINTPNGRPGYEHLGRALGLTITEPRDAIEVGRRIAQAVILTEDVERLVTERLEDVDPEIVIDHMGRAREGLIGAMQILGAPHQIAATIDDTLIARLQDWSRMLHRRHVEPEVTDETLAELERLVGEMRDALNAADDLDLEVEAFLREQLAVLARAVADVRLRGAKAVEDALSLVYGNIYRSAPRSGMQKAWTVVKALGAVLVFCSSMVSGAKDGTDLVLGNPDNIIYVIEAPTAPTPVMVPSPTTAPDDGAALTATDDRADAHQNAT